MDRRYQYPQIRDEAVLRTACGCEKIVSVPDESRIHQVRIQVDPPLELKADVTYHIRRFIWEGQMDHWGRRIFQERIVKEEPWEQRYRELYHDVYGMDKGL